MQHGMQIFMLFSNRWYDFHIYEYLFPLVLVMEHRHIPFSSQKNPQPNPMRKPKHIPNEEITKGMG